MLIYTKILDTIPFDFYNNNINNNDMININNSIYNILDFIKDKKILLLSSDYPGYGGAATNCNKLQNIISKYTTCIPNNYICI